MREEARGYGKKILILTSFVSGMGGWKRLLSELIRFYLKQKYTTRIISLSGGQSNLMNGKQSFSIQERVMDK